MTTVGTAAMSGREAEVLEALRAHLTNAEIAQRLHISVRTVESHVSSLLRKLGASDRRELAAIASDLSSAEGSALLGLPSAWTTFVGRERELAEVAAALGGHRLVTLVGPGGIGKTRLATVAADQAGRTFPAGGAFVDLVPVSAEFVVEAVAAALGVVERPQEPLDRPVHERLRLGRTLLLLDNCEHVLEAVATFVQSALAKCPGLVVLSTSRERLGLPGERVLPVAPLELRSEAWQLFMDRASTSGAAIPDTAEVAQICERLDGVPLAIELAAARSASLGVDGLVSGLDDRLRLLSSASGPAGRHRSLRAVIDWSHDLLDDDERTLFRRLAVFAGAFDLAAVAAVTTDGDLVQAGDGIARLTDKSLLVHRGDDAGSRWRMLETIHAYAGEKLDASGDEHETRRRHLTWAAASARDLEQSLDDDSDWQTAFDRVADDLRAALTAADTPGDEPFELARALGHLTYARRFLLEAQAHYAAAVRLAPDHHAAIAALREAADVALAQLRGEVGFDLLTAASARAREAGDLAAAAIALADAATAAGRMPATFRQRLTRDELDVLVAEIRGLAPADNLEVAAHVAIAVAFRDYAVTGGADVAKADESLRLARQLDDPALINAALDAVMAAATAAGRYKDASRLSAERVALLDRLPRHEPRSGGEVADVYHTCTRSGMAAGELHAALATARRSEEDPLIRQGLAHFAAAHLALPLAMQGEFDEALEHATVLRQGWERTGRPPAGWASPSFFAVALIHALRGDEVSYRQWWAMAEAIDVHSRSDSFRNFTAARIALYRGDLDAAMAEVVQTFKPVPGLYDAYASAIAAEVAVVAGAKDAEDRIAAAIPWVAENDFAAACVARATGRLHGDAAELERSVEGWESIGARFERACTLLLLPRRAAEGRRELAALGCAEPAAQSLS